MGLWAKGNFQWLWQMSVVQTLRQMPQEFDAWNDGVMADNINVFKNHLYKFWSSCEFVYSYSLCVCNLFIRAGKRPLACFRETCYLTIRPSYSCVMWCAVRLTGLAVSLFLHSRCHCSQYQLRSHSRPRRWAAVSVRTFKPITHLQRLIATQMLQFHLSQLVARCK